MLIKGEERVIVVIEKHVRYIRAVYFIGHMKGCIIELFMSTCSRFNVCNR